MVKSWAVQDTCSVAIPEDGLNLAPYCTPGAVKQVSSPLYDLFGVVCHYGSLEVSWCQALDVSKQAVLHCSMVASFYTKRSCLPRKSAQESPRWCLHSCLSYDHRIWIV